MQTQVPPRKPLPNRRWLQAVAAETSALVVPVPERSTNQCGCLSGVNAPFGFLPSWIGDPARHTDENDPLRLDGEQDFHVEAPAEASRGVPAGRQGAAEVSEVMTGWGGKTTASNTLAGRRPLLSRASPGRRVAGIWVAVALCLGGCSTVDAKRLAARPHWMCIRTTSYTHSEPGGGKSAIGTRLRFGGEVSSAAADWSWLPLGTRFRVQETGRIYVVEDYGSGLVAKRTVDLYMPSDSAMRAWGVRWVNVEILEWGSPAMSRMLLERRKDAKPVRQMLAAMNGEKD